MSKDYISEILLNKIESLKIAIEELNENMQSQHKWMKSIKRWVIEPIRTLFVVALILVIFSLIKFM